MAIESIALQAADKQVFQEAERAKMLTQPDMAAATMVAAQADAMDSAAHNPSGAGAMMGAAFFSSAQSAPQSNIFLQKDSSKPTLWRCRCGSMNTTNFCENCGQKRP